MATLLGKNGQVFLSAATSTVALLDNWSITFTSDKDEVTAFGEDWHSFTQTLQGATGRASGSSDPTVSGQSTIRKMFLSGASCVSVAMWLQEATGQVFTCSSVLIDSWDVGVPVGGKQSFAFGFTVNARPGHP